jgi:hypothetical protein
MTMVARLARTCGIATGAAMAVLALPVAAQPGDQRRTEQAEAMAARRAGRLLPLRDIERRVLPMMGKAQYLGFSFDSGAAIYTLKFLRDGTVIWVDVDGQSGQVLGSTGR